MQSVVEGLLTPCEVRLWWHEKVERTWAACVTHGDMHGLQNTGVGNTPHDTSPISSQAQVLEPRGPGR